jgi:putative lipoprotein
VEGIGEAKGFVRGRCGRAKEEGKMREAVFIFIGTSLLSACANVGDGFGGGSSARVTGTVAYLQRIALPPTAVVKVQLVDVSLADAPAIVLGEQVLTTGGKQVPFAFEIPYDPAKIESNHTYAVQVRIEEAGRRRFIIDQRYAVITRGMPTHVDMILRPVGGQAPN